MQLTARMLIFLSSTFITFACSTIGLAKPSDTRQWLKQNLEFNLIKISENVSPSDGNKGAIIAAKTRRNPNYYYHWVRDAGITINALITVYPELTTSEKQKFENLIFDYVDFSSKIQKVSTIANLGEPKFNVDGSAFNGDWSRPQNDSPAMRAISLIHFAKLLIAEGKESVVKEKLYSATMPALSPIKMDLEYVSYHWNDPSYDVWEEVKGTHFYTLMIMRHALKEGASLAHYLNDDGAADWYSKQAKEIENTLQKFWDPQRNYFVETINRVDGVDYKNSNLDIGVILGLLQGDLNDKFFAWDDTKVIGTMQKLIDIFKSIYPINNVDGIPGVAIGRYQEDRYGGADFNGGNPWPLCTLAIAEGLYRYAKTLKDKGDASNAEKVANIADRFVERVRYHANRDGSLNEQINRNSGYMTSVSDLTWNYAAMLSTRDSAMKV